MHDANEALCTQSENRYREIAVHLRALHDVLHDGLVVRTDFDEARPPRRRSGR